MPCTALQTIPDAISALTALTCLDLDMDCDSLDWVSNLQLPTSRLTSISSHMSCLKGLQRLTLRGANQLQALPDVFGALGKLQELRLIGEACTEKVWLWPVGEVGEAACTACPWQVVGFGQPPARPCAQSPITPPAPAACSITQHSGCTRAAFQRRS